MPRYEVVVINGVECDVFARAWLFHLDTDPRQAFSMLKNVLGGSKNDHGFAAIIPLMDSPGDQVLVMLSAHDVDTDAAIQIEKVVVDINGGVPIEYPSELQQALFCHAMLHLEMSLKQHSLQRRFYG